jgi:hypothetical protein
MKPLEAVAYTLFWFFFLYVGWWAIQAAIRAFMGPGW